MVSAVLYFLHTLFKLNKAFYLFKLHFCFVDHEYRNKLTIELM